MHERRWQPPPMENPQATSQAKVAVDEKVVRKMLAVNPALRRGRTTQQVKRAIERGEAIGASHQSSAVSGSAAAPVAFAPRARGHEFEETVGFFLRGKAEALKAQADEMALRRKALEAEEAQTKANVREQVVAFLALLDASTVDECGPAALAQHHNFLVQLGVSPASLVDQARKARRK